MTSSFSLLLHSRKFWLAVIAVVQTLLFSLVPNFPSEIWLAIDVLLGVLITAIAIEDIGAKLGGTIVLTAGGVLRSLLNSRKFWLAVVGIVQTVLFCLLPDFPEVVWQAVNGLIEVMILTIAVGDAAEKFRR